MSDKFNFQEEKKQHWLSYELKDAKDLKAVQNQEFYTSPDPVIQRIKTGDFDRKTFLKLMGASAAMATVNCLPQPKKKIVPYAEKPEFMTPGLSNYYASVCGGCESSCGILVKTKDGRPLKLEGNSKHPISKGGMCAQGQAGILNLYDPDRSREPAKLAAGVPSKITWKDLDTAVQKAIQDNKGKLRIVTLPLKSPTSKKLISEFLTKAGGGKHYEIDVLSPEDAIAEASLLNYGKAIVPNYRFDKAQVVFSLDADFLGTWISPVEFSKDFALGRKLKAGAESMNQLIMAETMPTVTGSNADLRIPVRPGDLKKLALALAKALSELGANANGLPAIDVDASAKEIDIKAEVIRTAAKKLWAAKGSSLVVGNSLGADAVEIQVLVNLLNTMLDNDGKSVDHVANRGEAPNYSKNLAALKADLNAGEAAVVLIYGVNPVYQLPENSGIKADLAKAKTVVSMADRIDETAHSSAHYLAPSSHYLEAWGDRESVKGVIAIQQPTIQPLYETRSLEDSLIAWAGGEISGKKSYYDYLKDSYGKTVNWVNLLKTGFSSSGETNANRTARPFKLAGLTDSKTGTGLSLTLYTTVGLGDGTHANNSVLLELPDPVSKVTWDNFLALSPALAKEKGIKSNDVVKVKVGSKELALPAQVQPGMHKNTVAVALGYGRTNVGKVGNGVGKNAYLLSELSNGRLVLSGMDASIEKTDKTYKLATTQDHHMMNPGSPLGTKWEDRPLIQHTAFENFQKNPESGKAPSEFPKITDKTKSDKPFDAKGFNPEYQYKGYKWGMSIDLTLCTGCSACVIACQIENNIPVVGRDEVRVGREMHWIRIDRYYMGDPDKPETVEIAHQPVMCQHCDNAPCETVCPVMATVHGSEGTNDMVYNRCVGTRYCSNNCPYKVRRYNWMEHWNDGKDMARSPRNLAFNPEVTVRARGVMEKCTFCASRVAEKKIRAKNEGRKVRDGELKSACQETCPADAITFGDVNNKETAVSKNSSDPRSYRILEFLNVKPQVAYQTRIRNYVKENA